MPSCARRLCRMANSGIPGKRGLGGCGAGRAKGTGNKIDAAKKAMLLGLVNGITESELRKLWKAASKRDALGALKMYVAACEYALPKLARIEHTGAEGGPQIVEVRCYGSPPEPRLTNDAAVLRERAADEE